MPDKVYYKDAPAPSKTEFGDLSSLTTTDKSSIVAAVNEVNAQKAKCIDFPSSATWATIWSTLSSLTAGETFTFHCASAVSSILTNGAITGSMAGTGVKNSSSDYHFEGKYGGNGFAVVRITSVNSSGIGSYDVNNISNQKTEYRAVDATSYSYNTKEGYDYVYDQLPTPYSGTVSITFGSGYRAFGIVYKYTNIYGSIVATVNDNISPFFYTRSNSSYGKIDQLALNNQIANIESITTGTVTEVQALSTSGIYTSYTVTTSGWYSVKASSGNTSGTGFSRIAIGNTVVVNVASSLGQYDQLLPPPIYIKAGTGIKGMAGFPTNGAGAIVRIS